MSNHFLSIDDQNLVNINRGNMAETEKLKVNLIPEINSSASEELQTFTIQPTFLS